MNFGSLNTRSMVNDASAVPANVFKRRPSGYRRIMSRSRLTEEDLEALRLDIIRTHRKKSIQFLKKTGIILTILLLIILILV